MIEPFRFVVVFPGGCLLLLSLRSLSDSLRVDKINEKKNLKRNSSSLSLSLFFPLSLKQNFPRKVERFLSFFFRGKKSGLSIKEIRERDEGASTIGSGQRRQVLLNLY